MSHLSNEEKQQLQFDWRYKGVSILNLLTESEVDSYAEELERIRIQRQKNDTKDEWGDYDPFMYPHKESEKLTDLMKHPKIIQACEFLMESKIFGVQTWAYFKPPGQLGRDQHQNIFYTQCNSNEIINVSIALDNHDPNNGSVWYLEGSHHLGRLPIEVDEERAGSNPKNWKNERGKPCILPDDHNFPHIDGYLRKGQVALLHSNVVHGSEPNISQRFRRAFLTGYVKEGSNFASGNHMKREPIDVGSAKINV
jgi:ectoine hydroxylase-related dioxygenase (phytanoyl-CoA dioxygenase family)